MSVATLVHLGDTEHAPFLSWLTAGADGEPEPAAAAHAMSCESCRNAIAAVDSLQAMDTSRADLPVIGAPPAPASGRWRWARHVFPASAILVLAVAQVAGSGTVMAPGAVSGNGSPDFWRLPFTVPGAPVAPSSPSSSPSTTDSAQPSITSEQQTQPGQAVPPSVEVPGLTPGPFTASGPVPSAPLASPSPAPRPPSATSRPSAPPPTPAPTRPPTPLPTAEPTPPPTVEPTVVPLPQCSDGIDNDGDGLIDFGIAVPPLGNNDPDCLSPDDNSEGAL